MDDDMPDFDEGPTGEGPADALLDEEDDIEAGLLAELDEDDAAQAGPSAAGARGAAAAAQPPKPPQAQQQQQQQQLAQPQQQGQPPPPKDEPLPLAPDGFVDYDRLTAEQRNKVTNTIVGLMTNEQLDRYEAYRRSSLKRPMRQLVKTVTNSSSAPNDKLMIAISSVAKTFVGELVETARLVATERGDEGPLQPLHIHVAYQRLQDSGKLPAKGGGGGTRRRPFV